MCPAESLDVDSKKTYNFKLHLARNHFDQFKLYIDERDKKATLQQPKISTVFTPKRDSTRLFTLYAATSTFPRNHLRNEYLKAFFESLKLKPPTEYELNKSIQNEMTSIQNTILLTLGTRKFSVATDALTTKSMTMSILGTVVFFIDEKKSKVQRAALTLELLTERHTGEYIRETALKSINSFGLDPQHVVRIVSDGAKNMKSAFL